MSDNDCMIMEMYCLERAKLEPKNRGRWIAQAGTLARAGTRSKFMASSEEAPSTVDGSRPDGNSVRRTAAGLTDQLTKVSSGQSRRNSYETCLEPGLDSKDAGYWRAVGS
jgi:hypothetical protein